MKKDGTMLKPAHTGAARELVVTVTAIGQSDKSGAYWIELDHAGEGYYLWLHDGGLKVLMSRRGIDVVGSRVPLQLRRVRNPRTGAMVDRYRVASHADLWERLDRGEW